MCNEQFIIKTDEMKIVYLDLKVTIDPLTTIFEHNILYGRKNLIEKELIGWIKTESLKVIYFNNKTTAYFKIF